MSNEEVAELTRVPKKQCAHISSGYSFSGGQSEIEATANLNQINIQNDTDFIMTYCMKSSTTKCIKILV